MHEQARRLLSLFSAEDRLLIIVAADPDAMASCLAFKRLLWRKVAGATIARANDISRPDNLAMARLLQIPMEPLEKIRPKDFSKLVMVDGQPHHIKGLSELFFTAIIDHHPPGECLERAAFADVRPRYGATASIMTEYLRGADIKPSARLATALVHGIKNDTANFQRPSLEEDVKAFQFLFPKANLGLLRKIEFSEMRLKDLEVLQRALEGYVARRHCIYVHLGDVKSPDNLVHVADFFLKIDSVDMTAVSGVHNGKLIIIIRSVGLRSHAGKAAEKVFGLLGSAGGHKTMARAEIAMTTMHEHLVATDHLALGRFVMHNLQHSPKAK
jgi:nanoRNase/pAp phosphatase (c-di-AMP/oligoRNAs hydrolase)